MNDADKTREQLLAELQDLRRQLDGTASRRQTALQRVRTAVWDMRHRKDIRQVLLAIRDELVAFGVPFQFCGVNILDDRVKPRVLTFHHVDHEGPEYRTGSAVESADLPFAKIWHEQQPVYRRDLEAKTAMAKARCAAAGSARSSMCPLPMAPWLSAPVDPKPSLQRISTLWANSPPCSRRISNGCGISRSSNRATTSSRS